jgi:hypothetical protein
MSFETAAQQIVYTALAGNITASVYDDVPYLPEGMPRNNFPYVVIGDDDTSAWDTDDTLGKEIDISIDIWSRTAGFKQTKAIMGEIYDILNRGALTKTGYNIVDCLCTESQALRDPDGITRHGVMVFKLTIQKET